MRKNRIFTVEELVKLVELPKEFRLVKKSTGDVKTIRLYEFKSHPNVEFDKVQLNKYESIKNCVVTSIDFDNDGLYSITYDDSNEVTTTRPMTDVEMYIYRMYLCVRDDAEEYRNQVESSYPPNDHYCCIDEGNVGCSDDEDNCTGKYYF